MRSNHGKLVKGLFGESLWALQIAGRAATDGFWSLELRTDADTYAQHFAVVKDGQIKRTFTLDQKAFAISFLENPEGTGEKPVFYQVAVQVSIQGYRLEMVEAQTQKEAVQLAIAQARSIVSMQVEEGSIEALRANGAGPYDRLTVSIDAGTPTLL